MREVEVHPRKKDPTPFRKSQKNAPEDGHKRRVVESWVKKKSVAHRGGAHPGSKKKRSKGMGE